jgi:hypothetical protein
MSIWLILLPSLIGGILSGIFYYWNDINELFEEYKSYKHVEENLTK